MVVVEEFGAAKDREQGGRGHVVMDTDYLLKWSEPNRVRAADVLVVGEEQPKERDDREAGSTWSSRRYRARSWTRRKTYEMHDKEDMAFFKQ